MRFVSSLAMGLAMGAAGLSLAALPATAVAKENKEKQAKPEFSEKFVPVLQELQKAEKAKDAAAIKAAIDKGEPLATSGDDKFWLGYYKYQLSALTNDSAMQKAGVTEMLASGKAPADMAIQLEGVAGQLAIQAGDPAGAVAHLEKATAVPTASADLHYLLGESYVMQAVKVAGGKVTPESQPLFTKALGAFQKAIDAKKAANQPVDPKYYSRGAEIARAINSPDAMKWQMADIGQGGANAGKSWESLIDSFEGNHPTMTKGEHLDVLRLKSAAGAMLTPNSYVMYVDEATKSGLSGEVKSIIDKGRAAKVLTATSLADDYTRASQRAGSERAGLAAEGTAAAKAANGKPASATADAYIGYGDYTKAIPLYELALQKGGVDAAEVNTRLGISKALSGDTAGAKEAFAKVTTGTRGDIAKLWVQYLDIKAGGAAGGTPAS